jgi:thioredoxin-like negative regulator of GroEL
MFLRTAILAALVALIACSAPQRGQPLSRNALAMQSAEAGALGEPALVEFYTTECISCRAIRGEVSALDQRYDGQVQFIYLDIDLPESQPFLAKYNVRGVPTIALLDRTGRLVANLPGWPGEQAVTDALDKLIGQP